MFRRLKKYLMNKYNPGLLYFQHWQKCYLGIDGFVPHPFWEWDYIFQDVYCYYLEKLGLLDHYKVYLFFIKIREILRIPYVKYITYWAKKNNLVCAPECNDSIGLDPRYEDMYDYYLDKTKINDSN